MTRLVRRDATFDSDYLELVIDSYHDHLSRAFFDLNPSGSKGDNIGVGTSCCDPSWDPIWEGGHAHRRRRMDGGDSNSVQPAAFPARPSCRRGGLQVRRFIKRQRRAGSVVVVGQDGGRRTAAVRASHGHAHRRVRRNLELLPYVVSKSSAVATAPGDPFNTHGRPTHAGVGSISRIV